MGCPHSHVRQFRIRRNISATAVLLRSKRSQIHIRLTSAGKIRPYKHLAIKISGDSISLGEMKAAGNLGILLKGSHTDSLFHNHSPWVG